MSRTPRAGSPFGKEGNSKVVRIRKWGIVLAEQDAQAKRSKLLDFLCDLVRFVVQEDFGGRPWGVELGVKDDDVYRQIEDVFYGNLREIMVEHGGSFENDEISLPEPPPPLLVEQLGAFLRSPLAVACMYTMALISSQMQVHPSLWERLQDNTVRPLGTLLSFLFTHCTDPSDDDLSLLSATTFSDDLHHLEPAPFPSLETTHKSAFTWRKLCAIVPLPESEPAQGGRKKGQGHEYSFGQISALILSLFERISARGWDECARVFQATNPLMDTVLEAPQKSAALQNCSQANATSNSALQTENTSTVSLSHPSYDGLIIQISDSTAFLSDFSLGQKSSHTQKGRIVFTLDVRKYLVYVVGGCLSVMAGDGDVRKQTQGVAMASDVYFGRFHHLLGTQYNIEVLQFFLQQSFWFMGHYPPLKESFFKHRGRDLLGDALVRADGFGTTLVAEGYVGMLRALMVLGEDHAATWDMLRYLSQLFGRCTLYRVQMDIAGLLGQHLQSLPIGGLSVDEHQQVVGSMFTDFNAKTLPVQAAVLAMIAPTETTTCGRGGLQLNCFGEIAAVIGGNGQRPHPSTLVVVVAFLRFCLVSAGSANMATDLVRSGLLSMLAERYANPDDTRLHTELMESPTELSKGIELTELLGNPTNGVPWGVDSNQEGDFWAKFGQKNDGEGTNEDDDESQRDSQKRDSGEGDMVAAEQVWLVVLSHVLDLIRMALVGRRTTQQMFLSMAGLKWLENLMSHPHFHQLAASLISLLEPTVLLEGGIVSIATAAMQAATDKYFSASPSSSEGEVAWDVRLKIVSSICGSLAGILQSLGPGKRAVWLESVDSPWPLSWLQKVIDARPLTTAIRAQIAEEDADRKKSEDSEEGIAEEGKEETPSEETQKRGVLPCIPEDVVEVFGFVREVLRLVFCRMYSVDGKTRWQPDWDGLLILLRDTGLMRTYLCADLADCILALAVNGPLPVCCPAHPSEGDAPQLLKRLLRRLRHSSTVTDDLLLHVDWSFEHAMRSASLSTSLRSYILDHITDSNESSRRGSNASVQTNIMDGTQTPSGLLADGRRHIEGAVFGGDEGGGVKSAWPRGVAPLGFWLAADEWRQKCRTLTEVVKGCSPDTLSSCLHQLFADGLRLSRRYLKGSGPDALAEQEITSDTAAAVLAAFRTDGREDIPLITHLQECTKYLQQAQREVYSNSLARAYTRYLGHLAQQTDIAYGMGVECQACQECCRLVHPRGVSLVAVLLGDVFAEEQRRNKDSLGLAHNDSSTASLVSLTTQDSVRTTRTPTKKSSRPPPPTSTQAPASEPSDPNTEYASSPLALRHAVLSVLASLVFVVHDSRFFPDADESVFHSARGWSNQPAMTSEGVLGHVLRAVGPEVFQNDRHYAHIPVMALIEALASYSMDIHELTAYMKLMKAPVFASCLSNTLAQVAYAHRNVPCYFYEFPPPPAVHIQHTPVTAGFSSIWQLANGELLQSLLSSQQQGTDGVWARACLSLQDLNRDLGSRGQGDSPRENDSDDSPPPQSPPPVPNIGPCDLNVFFPGEVQWPPVGGGYTLSFWLRLLPSSRGADSGTGSVATCQILAISPSFRPDGRVFENIVGVDNSMLWYAVSSLERVMFPEFTFDTERWHHVTISHANFSKLSAEVTLYVDGLRRGQPCPLHYAPPTTTSLTLRFNSVPEHLEWYGESRAYHHMGMMMSNFHFFAAPVVAPSQALLLFALGPDTYGQPTENTRLFWTYELVTGLSIHHPDLDGIFTLLLDWPENDQDPARWHALSPLHDKLMYVVSPRENYGVHFKVGMEKSGPSGGIAALIGGESGLFGASVDAASRAPGEESVPFGAATQAKIAHVQTHEAVTRHVRHSVKDSLSACGGMEGLLYLLAKIRSKKTTPTPTASTLALNTLSDGISSSSATVVGLSSLPAGGTGFMGIAECSDVYLHPLQRSHVGKKKDKSCRCRQPDRAHVSILGLLFEAMACHSVNTRSMERINGYDLLSRFVLSSRCEVTVDLLRVVLAAACTTTLFKKLPNAHDHNTTGLTGEGSTMSMDGNTSQAPIPNIYVPPIRLDVGRCVIKNKLLLHRILLDWGLWSRGPLEVQLAAVTALADLASRAHRHARFNQIQFREVGALAHLLHLFARQREFPGPITTQMVRLLGGLLRTPVTSEELRLVLQFLITTQSVPFDGPAAGSRGSGSGPEGRGRTATMALAQVVKGSGPVAVTSITVPYTSIREEVLLLLQSMLERSTEPHIDIVGLEVLDPDTMLSLVDGADTPTCTLTLLRILGVLLQRSSNNSYGLRFHKAKGWVLLGHRLRNCRPTDELIDVLADLAVTFDVSPQPAAAATQPTEKPRSLFGGLFGSKPTEQTLRPALSVPSQDPATASSVRKRVSFAEDAKPQPASQPPKRTMLERQPMSLVTLMKVLLTCRSSPKVWTYGVEKLHGCYVESEPIRTILLDNGLVEAIVEGMSTRMVDVDASETGMLEGGGISHDDCISTLKTAIDLLKSIATIACDSQTQFAVFEQVITALARREAGCREDQHDKRAWRFLLARQAVLIASLANFHYRILPEDSKPADVVAARFKFLCQSVADCVIWTEYTQHLPQDAPAGSSPAPDEEEDTTGQDTVRQLVQAVTSNVLVMFVELADMALMPPPHTPAAKKAQESASEQLGRVLCHMVQTANSKEFAEFAFSQLAEKPTILDLYVNVPKVNVCVIFYGHQYIGKHRKTRGHPSPCRTCDKAMRAVEAVLRSEAVIPPEIIDYDKSSLECVGRSNPKAAASASKGSGFFSTLLDDLFGGKPPPTADGAATTTAGHSALTPTSTSGTPASPANPHGSAAAYTFRLAFLQSAMGVVAGWLAVEPPAKQAWLEQLYGQAQRYVMGEHKQQQAVVAEELRLAGLVTAMLEACQSAHAHMASLQIDRVRVGGLSWQRLMQRNSHPCSVWATPPERDVVWRLDPVEGPNRMRLRLKVWKRIPVLPSRTPRPQSRSLSGRQPLSLSDTAAGEKPHSGPSTEEAKAEPQSQDGAVPAPTAEPQDISEAHRKIIRQANMEIARTLSWVDPRKLKHADLVYLYRTIIQDLPADNIDQLHPPPSGTSLIAPRSGLPTPESSDEQPTTTTTLTPAPEAPQGEGDGMDTVRAGARGSEGRKKAGSLGRRSTLALLFGRPTSGHTGPTLPSVEDPQEEPSEPNQSEVQETNIGEKEEGVEEEESTSQARHELVMRRQSLMRCLQTFSAPPVPSMLPPAQLGSRSGSIVQAQGLDLREEDLEGFVSHPLFLEWFSTDTSGITPNGSDVGSMDPPRPMQDMFAAAFIPTASMENIPEAEEGSELDTASQDELSLRGEETKSAEVLPQPSDSGPTQQAPRQEQTAAAAVRQQADTVAARSSDSIMNVPSAHFTTESFSLESFLEPKGGTSTTVYLQAGERVVLRQECTRITISKCSVGELIVGSSCIYFVEAQQVDELGDRLPSPNRDMEATRGGDAEESGGRTRVWASSEIKMMQKRRYLLQDIALEVFLWSGKTYLLAFYTPRLRDTAYTKIRGLNPPRLITTDDNKLRKTLTDKWVSGHMSNFEYLMHLNSLAGRSPNDLTQYPVLPWVLKDYHSTELDLSNTDIYRDLSRPMGAQNDARLARFIEKYQTLEDLGKESGIGGEGGGQPYHYGSHYSNIGAVLHFLVRLQPYTQHFVNFQGGRYDIPDRTFHSINQSWMLASALSSTDVKELIPEFFFLPEFLLNLNGCEFGVKQDGEVVDDVVLPPWAHGSARLFIMKHRQALESPYVTENLHKWIDLIFGCKQTGPAAVHAHNIFHPLTYEGSVDLDKIEDDLQRQATLTQIRSYGQTPKRLFTRPHPARKHTVPQPMFIDAPLQLAAPCTSLLGAPDADEGGADLRPVWHKNVNDSIRELYFLDGAALVALTAGKLLIPSEKLLLYWQTWDGALRLGIGSDLPQATIGHNMGNDRVTCAALAGPDSSLAVMGTEAGKVMVWQIARARPGAYMSSAKPPPSHELVLVTILRAHTGPIKCIATNPAFGVMVTGGEDGRAVVWDCNHFRFVRVLGRPEIRQESAEDARRRRKAGAGSQSWRHEGAVECLAVGATTGEMVTVCHVTMQDRRAVWAREDPVYSAVRLWTANGILVARAETAPGTLVNCVAMTTGREGVYVNMVVGGLNNGHVRVWSAVDMSPLLDMDCCSQYAIPLVCVTVSPDGSALITGDETGWVVWWGRVDKAQPNATILRRPTLVLDRNNVDM